MSDHERKRRPEPARTHPVRHPSSAFRSDAPPAGAGGATTNGHPDGHTDAQAAAGNPFAWPAEDPVSRAVRAGCDVVEAAVRRGFGLGRPPGPWGGAWPPGQPGQPGWTTGQWVDAATGAFTMWAQWLDAWSALARSIVTGGAEPAGAWPPPPVSTTGRSPAGAPSHTHAHAGTGALRLAVELRTARAVSVQLELSSGSGVIASGPSTALEVYGLLAPAATGAPPITDVTVAIAGGGVTVTLGSLEQHPAGTYAGAVLTAGRACGTLTVRLT